MPDQVLRRVVENKRVEVAVREGQVSFASLLDGAEQSDRSLNDALRAPGARMIYECKRSSPSKGVIRPRVSVEQVVQEVGPMAAAMSVLTDEKFFGGTHADLKNARAKFSGPILCKDFVLGPYQVVEARRAGADAILLMMSVLNDDVIKECLTLCKKLKMDALVEVHDEDELKRALALSAQIIGINNRDLRNLEIDLATTEKLAPLCPKDRTLVCESGIDDIGQVRRLSPLVNAFLVGSSVMSDENPAGKARELVFGRVKICGLTRPEDAAKAWNEGATIGGAIFASRSPRCVDVKRANEVFSAAPLSRVGVFVDAASEEMVESQKRVRLNVVQCHGQESMEARTEVRAILPRDVEVWQAVGIEDEHGSEELSKSMCGAIDADRVLFDRRTKSASGGTGQSFAHALLDGVDGDVLSKSVLAGGLSPENIRATQQVGCAILDVNSGVESAPGIKSEEKMKALFAALRPLSRGE
ncbi:MAG: bifunctional indole-3-glycerol-phosphate synthase TrpC/phosphoribosylanthranilate isomerase TrpF [Deltaproteobacteria bacterium]|nr:bifunctional indole-3-glycerol-phosphate synthase TrpC/phosphoribosylanthranilate isomerase TrpF [Deltaproteobacteria bacterium]